MSEWRTSWPKAVALVVLAIGALWLLWIVLLVEIDALGLG
jgi:hypothetical protein